ncbi:MAG: NAD(P)/FAD-dependent oxidoreductase [Thermoprotei archaeon]
MDRKDFIAGIMEIFHEYPYTNVDIFAFMDFDVVIIGAGSNGLSCACRLAGAGLRVGVFERSGMVGGAARTEELWPSFRVSSASYVLSLMPPSIMGEFELERFGLKLLRMDPSMVQPFPGGKQLVIWRDPIRTLDEVAKFSKRDAETAAKYYEDWERFFQVFDKHLLTPNPPRIGELEDELCREGLDYLVPHMLYGSVGEFMDEYFESDEVKTAFAQEAIIGSHAGPYTPGNMANMILHSMGMSTGVRGAWAYVEGGMGAVSRALLRAAESRGAKVFVGARVKRVVVRSGRAVGVELEDGRFVGARVVASNADIKTSVLKLLEPDHLPTQSRRSVESLKNMGVSMKVHLALDGLPQFAEGLDSKIAVSSIIHIAPSLEYLERAYDESKYFEPSSHPFVSLEFPTVYDTTLAPPEKHIASMFVQYAPYKLREGDWDEVKHEYVDVVLDTVQEYAPNIRQKILNTHVYSPKDLERVIGIVGGNIHHIDVTLPQSFGNRPLPGWGYTTPVVGYYLCGASTYPGGGVSGVCGYNAATKILNDIHNKRV